MAARQRYDTLGMLIRILARRYAFSIFNLFHWAGTAEIRAVAGFPPCTLPRYGSVTPLCDRTDGPGFVRGPE
jgi:hypothetical protein